uniref:LAM_G_DOMAIN domain-containing protein n=1 Tax=Mesocestoides corti TaxID=53468 RepID=A0A5K3FR81_MESCO
MEQHISPAVGALPEVVPLSLALRFSSAVGTGWRLDTPRLLAAAKAAQDQVMGGMFPRPKIIPSNLFERDFTLSFWLQREPKNDDDHESILCSQEDTATVGRALWISLKGCRIMVQMITRNPQTNQPLIDKVFRTYFFPRLPPSVCNPDGLTEGSQPWHHYSISITIDPETVEPTASTLMVDGESVGTLEQFGDTILVKRQSSEFFSQFITVGTCYDPSVPGSQQSLNGAIAGMTLLLGRNEDQSVSRCLAECGETLLIPRASSLITDNVNVILNSDNIVIESATSAEAAALLSNVAYVKPESTSTQLTYEPAGSNDRVLELSTTYRCGGRQLGNITTEKIALILQGSYSDLGDSAIAEAPDASAWMPKNEMRVPPQLKPQAPTALVLSILGQDVIRANIPVFEPGITMFPALEFTFSNVPFYAKSVARSAAMFVLDQCLVLPVNGSGLDFNDGERIVWPAGRAFELGVAVEPTQMGVLLKGRQTANQYASLLHGFRYWPPIEIEKRTNDMSLASGLLMERKFQLICSYNDAGYNTDPFTVQILLSSPVIAAETRAGKGVVYSDSSRDDTSLVNDNYLDNPYDDDDDDEDFDEEDDEMMQGDDPSAAETGQWPPPSGTVKRLDPSPAYKSAMGVAQFAHSDKEVRSGDSLRLQKKQKLEEGGPSKVNNFGLAVGLGVGGLAVVIIILAFFITKSTGFRRGQLSFFRRVDRKGTGRIQFRPEARLNVIENPIENLEGGRLNWQPPTTVPPPTMSEGLPSLPGVHGAYGGRDEQFDAETRSFNGLFEEEEEEGAAAVLEEVDDFDESEAVMTQTMERVDEDDEEGASDQEDETSFSMGPNHLEFVTLPDPRRGFNADV